MSKKQVLSVCSLVVLTFASPALMAQRRVDHFPHSPNVIPLESPAVPLKVIFSNLGPTPTNAYNDTGGFLVLGPTSFYGQAQWIAAQFTPKGNATVTQLQVAVEYDFYGAKGIIVGLYSDVSGNVGTPLATAAASSMPDLGTCCQLVSVSIPATAVSAGTPYWVGVTSDDVNAPDFVGAWDNANIPALASNIDEGSWSSFTNNSPAFAVKGTVP